MLATFFPTGGAPDRAGAAPRRSARGAGRGGPVERLAVRRGGASPSSRGEPGRGPPAGVRIVSRLRRGGAGGQRADAPGSRLRASPPARSRNRGRPYTAGRWRAATGDQRVWSGRARAAPPGHGRPARRSGGRADRRVRRHFEQAPFRVVRAVPLMAGDRLAEALSAGGRAGPLCSVTTTSRSCGRSRTRSRWPWKARLHAEVARSEARYRAVVEGMTGPSPTRVGGRPMSSRSAVT